MNSEKYDRHTPVKILYEERKKRGTKYIKENIKLYTGTIEDTKRRVPKTKQQ